MSESALVMGILKGVQVSMKNYLKSNMVMKSVIINILPYPNNKIANTLKVINMINDLGFNKELLI